ncbi:MAG: HEAT repeat domain-containing protein [Myxococcota bacterium]|jgi:hypothetical protein|nr:HEAT repeat domain-containing protein [Myxococcota bacterium]
MGLLDIFSKEKRQAKRLVKEIRTANNKYTPKDYRQVALSYVIEEAKKREPAAITGLLTRFAVNAEPSTEDEKEKDWACETLVEVGRDALPQLRKSLGSAESVTWMHRILRQVVTPDEYKAELLHVLDGFDTEYERNPDRKVQTIVALADVQGAEVVATLIRFLDDVDETARFQTVAALAKHADEQARTPLLDRLVKEESIRVRNEIIEAFAQLGWSTTGFKNKIDELLPKGFRHEKTGKIVKLGQ